MRSFPAWIDRHNLHWHFLFEAWDSRRSPSLLDYRLLSCRHASATWTNCQTLPSFCFILHYWATLLLACELWGFHKIVNIALNLLDSCSFLSCLQTYGVSSHIYLISLLLFWEKGKDVFHGKCYKTSLSISSQPNGHPPRQKKGGKNLRHFQFRKAELIRKIK